MPTITVLNDLHLKPSYDGIVTAMSLPPATDVLVVAGDLIDKSDQQSIQLGRRVLRRFDRSSVPTIVIPGNHDPLATTKQLVADFETVYLTHQRRLTTEELLTNAATDKNINVVGWGCTRFDVGREVPYETAEAFDIYDEYGHINEYQDSEAVAAILDRIDDLITGRQTPSDLCAEIGIDSEYENTFADIRRTARSLIELLVTDADTLLVSHVPPFGTTLDIHHSAENRSKDGLHTGWLALSGAIRRSEPIAGAFGHSHIQGYDSFDTVDSHLINGGFRGITTIDIGESGVSFSFHTAGWLPGEE